MAVGESEAGASRHGSNSLFVTCNLKSGVSVDKMVAVTDHCQDSHRYPTEIVSPVYVRNRASSNLNTILTQVYVTVEKQERRQRSS